MQSLHAAIVFTSVIGPDVTRWEGRTTKGAKWLDLALDEEEMVKKMSDADDSSDGKGARGKTAHKTYALKVMMELVLMQLTAIEGRLTVLEHTAALGLKKLADWYRGPGDKRGEVVGEGQVKVSDFEMSDGKRAIQTLLSS